MSLLRSILVRGRPSIRSLFIQNPPCFSRRLGLPKDLVLCRAASCAGASFPRSHVEAAEKIGLYDPEPKVVSDTVSPTSSGIRFESQEASYYHKCLEKLPQYKDTIFTRDDLESLLIADAGSVGNLLETKDWSHASPREIVESFRRLTSYARTNGLVISNPEFDSICHAISGRLKEFTDDEVIEIGKLHNLWFFPPSASEKNYELLRQSLDEYFVSRYTKEWYKKRSYTKILQAADIFYWQRWGSRSHFLRLMIYHLGMKTKEHHHLIQIMFYMGLLRNIPDTFKMYDLEKRIFSMKDKCSLAELCVVMNSLFRVKKTAQYYPFLEEVLVKTLKNFSSVDDYLLTTISKVCSDAPPELRPLIALLQRRVTLNFDNFEMRTIIHAMWTFVKVDVVEEDFAQMVYEKSINNLSNFRTKELTRIITMFTELESPRRDLKCLAEKILVELQNSEKLDWFQKKDFISGGVLHRFLICGICPDELLNSYLQSIDQNCVSSRIISVAQKSNEALGIDVHLEVFHPNYTGARLDPSLREAIFKHRFQSDSDFFVKSSGTKGKRSTFNLKWIQLIQSALLEVVQGGDDNFLITQLVPSFGYKDVVLRISQEGMFLPIPEEMKSSEPWKITKIPIHQINDGDKFIALTFIRHPNEYISRKISCFQREKKNILHRFGYLHEDVSVGNWIGANPSQLKTNLKTVISEILRK
ncbi:FAST kinase domain-containing protein 5, mitochondrial [Frankliniella fusca]|uniref:FAST kinase domain-containing protein 5, mitochondrial n=1 Tax=Frankliniella fusca TaxID=407009 RepID=A0AAE1HGT9_9NEOP|nr:FAST kinase domain-containing protein 5, mitochondrial [Frankliniella fusca]